MQLQNPDMGRLGRVQSNELLSFFTIFFLKILILFILMPSAYALAQNKVQDKNAAEKSKQAELARVAIIDFHNKTGSPNYQYLASSLSSAIGVSMRDQFEYFRVDPMKTQRSANLLYKVIKEFDQLVVSQFSMQHKADILIYGDYNYDKKKDLISINTRIYFLQPDVMLNLDSIENKIDSTLFTAVDKVANQIVQAIADLARQQSEQNKEGKQDLKGNTPTNAQGKIVLRKEAISKSVEQSQKSKGPSYHRFFVAGELFGPAIYGSFNFGFHIFHFLYVRGGLTWIPRDDFTFHSNLVGLGFKAYNVDFFMGFVRYEYSIDEDSPLNDDLANPIDFSDTYSMMVSFGYYFNFYNNRFFIKPEIVYVSAKDDFLGKIASSNNDSFWWFGMEMGLRFSIF